MAYLRDVIASDTYVNIREIFSPLLVTFYHIHRASQQWKSTHLRLRRIFPSLRAFRGIWGRLEYALAKDLRWRETEKCRNLINDTKMRFWRLSIATRLPRDLRKAPTSLGVSKNATGCCKGTCMWQIVTNVLVEEQGGFVEWNFGPERHSN